MYLVTTHASYRLDADAGGAPQVSWRIPYDRGTKVKPGMLSQGSGTSPTLIGDRWIAIADNAEPRSNVIVYDRRLGVADRLHCQVPVLANGASTTENSLVAAGESLIIENNYGYSGVQATLLGKSTTPGMARVMIDPVGCHVAWTNNEVRAPSSVAKASLGNGLIYAYTKPVRKDLDRRLVPHRHRHPHRPGRLEPADRHRHPVEQPLRRDLPRPRRHPVRRHRRRADAARRQLSHRSSCRASEIVGRSACSGRVHRKAPARRHTRSSCKRRQRREARS